MDVIESFKLKGGKGAEAEAEAATESEMMMTGYVISSEIADFTLKLNQFENL